MAGDGERADRAHADGVAVGRRLRDQIEPDGERAAGPVVDDDLLAELLAWNRPWGDVNLYFDIQNIENRRNIEGRTYNDATGREDEVPSLPIMPFVGLEFLPK